jgi:hypothetical protein
LDPVTTFAWRLNHLSVELSLLVRLVPFTATAPRCCGKTEALLCPPLWRIGYDWNTISIKMTTAGGPFVPSWADCPGEEYLLDKTMTKSSITAIDEQLVVGSLFSKALNKVVDTPNKSSKEAKQTKAPLFFYDFNVIPPVEELGSWKRTMLLLCGRISSHPLFFRPPCHPHLSTKLLGLIIFPTWSQVVC